MRGLYFRCMKNSTTSDALTIAMLSATTAFSSPRSKKATVVVIPVNTTSAAKTL
jgi:hypothetical protein